jgi:hypothetical protein
MKFLIFLSLLISIKVYAEMSPEESVASDYVMIEQSIELKLKLRVTYFDEISKIDNNQGSFYTVVRDRCLAIVEVASKDSKKPVTGRARRYIKEVKGPFCFK